MSQPLRVLFVCDGSAARSQMAAGLLRHLGGNDFEVYSASRLCARFEGEFVAVATAGI